jgi:hypothetical protein
MDVTAAAPGAKAARTDAPLAVQTTSLIDNCPYGIGACEIGDFQTQVFYVDATNDIHMLGFIPNDGNWTETDMTSSVGAAKY